MIRRMPVLIGALLLAMGLGACSPAPEPTPSSTGFASDEEAFAAAEETYRAYVDALNAVDLSDPETFEGVYAWTTGEANAADRRNLSEYHAAGVSVTGTSRVHAVSGVVFEADDATTVVRVCLNVSDVRVVAASRDSLVDPDRVDIQTLYVTLELDDTSLTRQVITTISPGDNGARC